MPDIVYLLAGLGLLVIGGEFLVRGAVAVAERFGMSPLLIGLTLVGFGTSTPELVTSVQAAIAGSPGIAVGNIVGSNIANVLLILGLSALITPIAVGSSALKRDGVIVLLVAVLFAIVSYAYTLDRIVGVLFIAALVGYIVFAYLQERTPTTNHTAAYEKAEAYAELHDAPTMAGSGSAAARDAGSSLVPLMMAIGGLAIVVVGGKLLVDGAVGMARSWGISETVIGLTIVAVGTSMPEFVTSIVAAFRKHSDVALGNILGSNIYNILGIGGVTALIQPTAVPEQIVTFDNLAMIGACAALLLFAATGRRIGRLEGALLLAGYVAYVYLIWPASPSAA